MEGSQQWGVTGHRNRLASRDSFAITYIARAAEASRYEGGDDHEGDNSLDRSGYVSHLASNVSSAKLQKLFL